MSIQNGEFAILVEAKRVLVEAGIPLIDDGAVLVADERILGVGTPSELMRISDRTVKRINLGDVTLLPGMIDSHVHLGYEPAQDHGFMMNGVIEEPKLLALMLYNAGKLVRAGVTTIRELGSKGNLGSVARDVISNGWAPGPRVLASNEPLTTTGGHAWFLGGECDSIDELRKAVRNHHKIRSDMIKIMVTGGGLTSGSVPWRAQFSPQEVDAVVMEASRLGMPIAAHVHGTEGIAIATKAGVTTLEHCTWMGEDGVIGHQIDSEILQEIVDRGIFVCPTASSRWEMMEPERRASKIQTVARMHQAGVRIIAGTDAGIEHVPYENYVKGLEWLHQCGLSNQEVIASATSLAAEACGIANITGTLSVGKSADMFAVKGNPLENIGVLSEPLWVLARGRPVAGNDLLSSCPDRRAQKSQ